MDVYLHVRIGNSEGKSERRKKKQEEERVCLNERVGEGREEIKERGEQSRNV